MRFTTAPLLLTLAPAALSSFLPQQQQPLQANGHTAHKGSLRHDLIEFHKNLVEIESISGNEKAVGTWLASSLEAQGYSVEKQYLSKDPERFNLLAWPGTKRDARVLLSSHIDVVPPYIPYKFEKFEHNNTISGRGTVDAKGSVATQIIAINNLISASKISSDDVAVLYVIGEEVGGDGMEMANDYDIHPETIIFGEPTERKLISGHKGAMKITVRAKGHAAHSGYPWLGRSANEVLIAALTPIITLGDRLPKSDKYGKTTLNVGVMQGGVASNVVAENATADVQIRIAAGTPQLIIDEVTKAVHKAVEPFLSGPEGGEKQHLAPEDVIEIEFPTTGYGAIDLDHDIPGFDSMPVNYGTDIPHWKVNREGQKRYLYGPGNIFVAHSDHEALTEQELFDAVDGYEKIVLYALGNSK